MRIFVLAAALLCAGWNYAEHLTLGNESYRRACGLLRSELATQAPTDPAVAVRLEVACDNIDIAAQLYGQSTALAGDRFGSTSDFLSTRAGWKVASRKEYYTLALANSTHFHPYATREWWSYHARAVQHAADASKKLGLDAVNGLQLAIYEAAFADHFLHDAFCAGHMGFNRAASSVAASLIYHDRWNEQGRVVRDRAGRSWRTYGDGRFDDKDNAGGREAATRVATRSIYGVLRAFVFGARDPNNELEIWRSLPYVIEAPELPSLADRLLGVEPDEDGDARKLQPLEAINWPARKDRVLDVSTVIAGTFEREAPLTAILLGYYVSLPLVSAPIHVGAGASLPRGESGPRFAASTDLNAPLGLTNDGVLEHHLTAGAVWEVRYRTLSGSVWAGYQLNIELGRNLIQLQVGPAFVAPQYDVGFTAKLGFARVLSAAGGGVR